MKSRIFLALLVSFSLAGCSALVKTPAPLPTVVLDSGGAPQATRQSTGGGVTASAVVAPSQQARLVFTLAGRLETVEVAVGDQVQAGQVLASLEGQETLQAAISAAQFELALAEQALKDLAEQAETARVQAMQEVVVYAQAVKDAQYALDNFTIPAEQAGLDAVTALKEMKQRLDQARAAFEPYRSRSSSDQTRQNLKEALDEAQSDYNAAVRRLKLEYDLAVAETRLANAQQDYDIYQAGPDPDQVRLADARVANAHTQLASAEAALGNLTLTAPFAGTVSRLDIHRGEWVLPGQAALALVDLTNLQVETTDLSEKDIPAVEIGQAVTVFIEALNQEVRGRVALIAPLADTLGGDVVYKVTIELDELIAGLRAGMSAEVQFEPGQ
ncbi:MAG: efflux RND transporter periplasmic adaptor subunit [Anaerolineales bacterium]|nr:efflux RND transporter periplasmic adaptor subunit [Anaerolineales bacterium]